LQQLLDVMMFIFKRPLAAVLSGLAIPTVLFVVDFVHEHASGRGWM
jgi:hypothetical protein